MIRSLPQVEYGQVGRSEGQAEVDENYRLLRDNAREIIARLSCDLTFLYASPAARRVLGYPSEQLVGQRLDDLVHPDDIAGVVSVFTQAQSAGESVSTAMRMRAAGSCWRWCEIFCRGVASNVTGSLEIHAVIQDTSRFKHIETAIDRVVSEWRNTFDAARDAIVMLDRDARVVRVNLATTRLFDCSFSEVLGRPLHDVTRERWGFEDPFGITEVWSSRAQVCRDVRLDSQAGGSVRWLRSTVDLLGPRARREPDSSGAIVFLADVSREMQAEERLREALAKLGRMAARLQLAADGTSGDDTF